MQKVIVIGCPGSGKSTFSKALHDSTGLLLYHLDMMNWNADGANVPKRTFMERLHQALEKESWIIDENYIYFNLNNCHDTWLIAGGNIQGN